jgi:nucleoside-diphosphate-sugar epimerase
VLQALSSDDAVDEIVAVARRVPALRVPKTRWTAADVVTADLAPIFEGADCVVHLAWQIQPSHDVGALRKTNVAGSSHVFAAVADAGVPALVYASSVGAYSPGPKDRAVDESWPTDGTPTSFYARHKAEVERLLDRFETEHPEVRVVRLRPALIFKRGSGAEQRRYFLGPLFPRMLARTSAIPVVPDLRGLRFQAVHADDVGDAYRRAVVNDVARGAYNIAAEPILDPDVLAHALSARKIPLPVSLARGAMAVSWRLRLQPTPRAGSTWACRFR